MPTSRVSYLVHRRETNVIDSKKPPCVCDYLAPYREGVEGIEGLLYLSGVAGKNMEPFDGVSIRSARSPYQPATPTVLCLLGPVRP